MKQHFFNLLNQCDDEFIEEHWREFINLRRFDPTITIKAYASYAMDMWDHSESMKQW